jgi:formate dehydrogenase major subunit
MRSIIGEGAATNPFRDIKNCEFMIVIGSNTTEAHPIVANKIIRAKQKGMGLAIFDVRDIALSKFADHNCIIPHESNLLLLNMLAHVIITEELYDEEFIKNRTHNFLEYKKEILEDEFADPEFFQKIEGYEYLTDMIKSVAREYASKR